MAPSVQLGALHLLQEHLNPGTFESPSYPGSTWTTLTSSPVTQRPLYFCPEPSTSVPSVENHYPRIAVDRHTRICR